jgi:hypothetical protein
MTTASKLADWNNTSETKFQDKQKGTNYIRNKSLEGFSCYQLLSNYCVLYLTLPPD